MCLWWIKCEVNWFYQTCFSCPVFYYLRSYWGLKPLKESWCFRAKMEKVRREAGAVRHPRFPGGFWTRSWSENGNQPDIRRMFYPLRSHRLEILLLQSPKLQHLYTTPIKNHIFSLYTELYLRVCIGTTLTEPYQCIYITFYWDFMEWTNTACVKEGKCDKNQHLKSVERIYIYVSNWFEPFISSLGWMFTVIFL